MKVLVLDDHDRLRKEVPVWTMEQLLGEVCQWMFASDFPCPQRG